MGTLPPLSLYVHLPWCVRKCPYCDFNSYAASGALPEREYVEALLRDLGVEVALTQGRPLESIYIGGGTPSLFSSAAVARLLDGIRACAPLADTVEITLEANPGAFDAERFAAFCAAGVNRLSIGVQSFRNSELATLGRVHCADEARRAAEAALGCGFRSVNLDLMYGLPGDDLEGALGDLDVAIGLAPTHLSWYQLTVEPNTAFHHRPPPLPDEDTIVAIESEGRALLDRCGFQRYEVSAYSQPGHRCRHNLNYWRFGDYVGIGAGAHGKLTLDSGVVVRRTKRRKPRAYITLAGSPSAFGEERIDSPGQLVLEFMMNALRLPEGVSVASYEERTGQSRARIEKPLRAALERGWLAPEAERLKPTAAGLQMLNPLLRLFAEAVSEEVPRPDRGPHPGMMARVPG